MNESTVRVRVHVVVEFGCLRQFEDQERIAAVLGQAAQLGVTRVRQAINGDGQLAIVGTPDVEVASVTTGVAP